MDAGLLQKVNPIKKVAIVGPECTGKTSLAALLANYYHTQWVPEYARGYLDKLAVPYTENDLLRIAQGQVRIEDEFARDADQVLICDTNLIVIKIWSEFKFKRCDAWVLEEMNRRTYDLHFLTNIDIPWVADPQREHPNHREHLYALYKEQLNTMKVAYVEIKGSDKERFKTAVAAIDKLMINE
jgi:NadR type nicotinamide-nucleotide adenylyltransferase